jgi:NAD(P)-dependent dehydrogenase (short-subunit alcohol dehydrogenase family)
MPTDLSSWSVIVTGGSSGLGAAVGAALGDAGATVTSLDYRRSDVLSTLPVDLADSKAAAAATRTAIERTGRLDALVCCAGVDSPGPLVSVGREDWERVIAVNLIGTAAVTRAALPALIASHGRIVTVASTLGHRAVSDATAYCASKFGVIGFTRALAAELRGSVGVTLLTPGGMQTNFFDGRDPQYRPSPDTALADPVEVAEAVVWTLSRPAGLEVKELAVMAPSEGSWP